MTSKDLAVAIAVKEIKDFPIRPPAAQLETIAEVCQLLFNPIGR